MFERREKQQALNRKVEVYMDEYKLVVNKITSLSLKFSGGSYIIPFSAIVGLASVKTSNTLINVLCISMPVVIILFLYNHVRYMALQFKLSGYAKHLELCINELLDENVLLWENRVARGNGQNLLEGALLGFTYFLIFLLMYYVAYIKLCQMLYTEKISHVAICLITAIYAMSLVSFVVFLLLFTNQHGKAFHLSQDAFKSISNDGAKSSCKKWLRKIGIIIIIVVVSFLIWRLMVIAVLHCPNCVMPIAEKH